jgi:hypothetical protein
LVRVVLVLLTVVEPTPQLEIILFFLHSLVMAGVEGAVGQWQEVPGDLGAVLEIEEQFLGEAGLLDKEMLVVIAAGVRKVTLVGAVAVLGVQGKLAVMAMLEAVMVE